MFNSENKYASVDINPFFVKVLGRKQFDIICEFMKSKDFPISSAGQFINGQSQPLYNEFYDYSNLLFIKNNHGVLGFYGIATEIIINCECDKFTFDEFVERYIDPPKDPGNLFCINADLLGKR